MEDGALEIQQVECFEREGATAAWRAVGEGTVLWQAGAEGRMEQRLLVMQPDERGEWARELEALDFPDPCASISCQPDDSVVMWRRMGESREVALAFRSSEGCLQVWDDIQALQSLVMHAMSGAPGAAQSGESDYLDQFSDLYGDDMMGGWALGTRGGQPLPPPTEDALPAIAMQLAACPPGLAPLLLQQLVGDSATTPSSPSASSSPSAANLAKAARTLATPPAPDAPARDYVGQLAALAAQLSSGDAAGGGPPSPATSSDSSSSGTSSAPATAEATAPASSKIRQEGGTSPNGKPRDLLASSDSDAAIYRATARMQLGAIFRALLTIAADDSLLLQRLLQPDALVGLMLCLESDESRLHYQTTHVNTQHLAFLIDKARFRMPCPIADATVLARVHQNFVIAYLTDAALPLSLEPGASAVLAELQSNNGKEIVAGLAADDAFLAALFDGLGAGPPSGFTDGSLGVGTCGGGTREAAPRAAALTSGADGGVTPAPAPEEPLYLQQWGVLRELTGLSALLHPIAKTRVYKALAGRGLLRAMSLALTPAVGGCGSTVTVGAGRRHAIDCQVRALDVLLNLLNHDCSIIRLACVDLPASAAWGERSDARALVAALVRLLGESSDEGLICQVAEAVRIIIDPSSMEPEEHNAFLDFLYGSGQLASILRLLRARAREALAPGQQPSASAESDGGRPSPPDAPDVGTGERMAAGSEGAGYAGPRVARIEALLEVIGCSFGVHGYRSQRLTQDANLWHAMSDLLTQPRGSLRASATRLLRTMLILHPMSSTKVRDHNIAAMLIAQLRTRPAPDGSPRDSLANSAVLSLLQSAVEQAELAPLRNFLLTAHVDDVKSLAAQRVIPCVALLHSASVDLASAAMMPREADLGNSSQSSAGSQHGGGGSPASLKSPNDPFQRARSPSPPASRSPTLTTEHASPHPPPSDAGSHAPSPNISPSNPGLGPTAANVGAFAPSANSAFTSMRSRGSYSDVSTDSPQRSPPSLPTPPSVGGLSAAGTPPSGGGGISAGVGQLLSAPPAHPLPPSFHAHSPAHHSPSGVENLEANRPVSPRPGSAGASPTKPPPALPAHASSALGGGRPLTPR